MKGGVVRHPLFFIRVLSLFMPKPRESGPLRPHSLVFMRLP